MRGPRPVWLIAALAVSLLGVAVGAHAIQGIGALEAGSSHYVQVAETDDSGVLAGLVTETREGPLGLARDSVPVTSGWVVAHPEDTSVAEADEIHVVEEVPFEDPNGGAWMERVVTVEGERAWAVPVDRAREDPSLEGPYNFALVVDWDHVPEGQDLTTSYVEELTLEG